MKGEKINELINRIKPKPIIVGKVFDVNDIPSDEGYVVGDTPFLKKVEFPKEYFSFIDGAFEYSQSTPDDKVIEIEFSFRTKRPHKLFGFESISDDNICRLKEYSKTEYTVGITFLTKEEEDFIRNIKVIMIDPYYARKSIPLRFKFNKK